MINYKTKNKITLVLASSILVTTFSSCAYSSTSKEDENVIDHDAEINQILEENIQKFKEINNNDEEVEETSLKTQIFNSIYDSSSSNKNLMFYEYGSLISPLSFNNFDFLKLLSDNSLKLGDVIQDELFKNIYNISLDDFIFNYELGVYNEDSDIDLMLLIIRYNKYLEDLKISSGEYIGYNFETNNEIANIINKYYEDNNINLKWNEVPAIEKSFQKSLNNN